MTKKFTTLHLAIELEFDEQDYEYDFDDAMEL